MTVKNVGGWVGEPAGFRRSSRIDRQVRELAAAREQTPERGGWRSEQMGKGLRTRGCLRLLAGGLAGE